MTAEQRFERELPGLLADLYPESAPDYRNDLVRQIAATRQRPAWAFPERWIPMSVLVLGRAVRPLPWRTISVAALLVLAILAALIVAGSQRRLPPPFGPALNGQLVASEAGDIVLIDPDTGRKVIAIGGPAVDVEPLFSRDGTRIAFFREADGGRSLWTADDRGIGARELSTTGLVDISQIEWSPDGASILVTTSVDGRTAPAIVPVDGSAGHVISLDMPAESPIWLPGGEVLFRGVDGTDFGLYAIRPDGTGLRTIVPAARRNADNEYDVLFYAPSPDALQVAYQLRDGDGTQKIFLVPVGGGTAQVLTEIESAIPVWSPDGDYISFLSDNDAWYVVPADGSTAARLLTVGTPTNGSRWAPDGQHLLIAEESGTMRLYDPRGGAPTVASWTTKTVPDWQRLALPSP